MLFRSRWPQGTVSESQLLLQIAATAGISLAALTQKPDLTFALLEALGMPGRTLAQLPDDGLPLAAPVAATAGAVSA